MPGDSAGGPRLPEHPELRDVALLVERMGMMGEILDHRFRCVFISSEAMRTMGASLDEADAMLGRSAIARATDERFADIVRLTDESAAEWARHNVPIIRHFVQPDDADFEEIFDTTASYAARVRPVQQPPRAWYDTVAFHPELRFRRAILGDQRQGYLRINDDAGNFVGVLWLYRGTLGDSLLFRLGRGDRALYERMERVSEPARRSTAILFADLEASGALAQRLSSRGYFELIRDVTDLIDSSVIARGGIVGKHAGDGGSALFLADDAGGSESAAARAAIEAARAIRDGAAAAAPSGVPVVLNVGLHWGATLMVGQVATAGRLEVTALGDQMNQCARIESVAKGGVILASKDVLERLEPTDAEATGLDPQTRVYQPLADLAGVSEKAARDAGMIAVSEI